jgi:trimethylamine:corrinoid methyltransferase-like protein
LHAGGSFVLCGRDPANDVLLEPGRVCELSVSSLPDRRVRAEWEADGAMDAAARASAEALRILDCHQVEPCRTRCATA